MATRKLRRPKAKSHPCAVCGRFHFPKPGTVCYWCTGRQALAANVWLQEDDDGDDTE